MIIAVILLILMKITIVPESVRLETCGHGARDHILHSFRTGIAKKFVRLESGELFFLLPGGKKQHEKQSNTKPGLQCLWCTLW